MCFLGVERQDLDARLAEMVSRSNFCAKPCPVRFCSFTRASALLLARRDDDFVARDAHRGPTDARLIMGESGTQHAIYHPIFCLIQILHSVGHRRAVPADRDVL